MSKLYVRAIEYKYMKHIELRVYMACTSVHVYVSVHRHYCASYTRPD